MPTIDQLTAGKIMRDEITTYSEYLACGNYSEVAKKYKVSPATAHGWMMSLKAKHMGIEPEQKQKSKAQIMREELTTLEKFEAIGGYREVAAKYGVGKTAANDWHVKLRREKEKMEAQSVKAIETGEDKPIKIPCQSVEDGVESVQNESEGDCSKEGIEEAVKAIEEMCSSFPTPDPECYKEYGQDLDGCSRQENQGCNGCRCFRTDQERGETINDLPFTDELAEPEPTWNYDLIADEIQKPVTDEEILQGIKQDIQELRERAHKRADKDIVKKVLQLMGC